MIIGISGQAGCGKDTAADILVAKHECVKVSLADPLKRICRDVFDFSEQQLWGPSECRNTPDKRYLRKVIVHKGTAVGNSTDPLKSEREYLTPRYSLQKLGTEWGRDCYYNVWINYAIRIANKLLTSKCRYTSLQGLIESYPDNGPNAYMYRTKHVVIPDCRFANEFLAIKKADGKLLRIKRPGAGLKGEAANHPSEAEQRSVPDSEFDYVIDNDGTIPELAAKLADIMH